MLILPAFLCISLAKVPSLSRHSTLLHSNNHPASLDSETNNSAITTWLDINFSDPQAAKATNHLLKSLLNRPTTDTGSPLYELHVTGSPYLGNWPLLRVAIGKLPNIELLHWESQHPIPSKILDTLKIHHPSCRLYYTIPFNFQDDPFDPAYTIDPDWDSYDGVDPGYWTRNALLERRTTELLPAIVNSTALYSLKADIEYGVDDNFASLELVLEILANSPNLRELDLHLYSVGCLLGSVPWAFDFLSSPSVRFPPLEILRIRGYDLNERSDGGDKWRYKGYDWSSNEHPPPERDKNDQRSNLDVWLEIMDWSQLHTLEIVPSVQALEKVRGRVLPSLRHLSLKDLDWSQRSNNNSNVARGISAFIRETTRPLRSLVLWNIEPESWKTLLGPGEWPEKLWDELGSFTVGSDENSNFVDGDAFTAFMTSSPKLRRLDMSMERSKLSIDDLYYRAIASSPSLEHLTLRFPTPDTMFLDRGLYENETLLQTYTGMRQSHKLLGDEGDETDAVVNSPNLLVLFRALRAQKVGGELRSLDAYVGNWLERNRCDFTDMGPMVRVARYRCWVEEGVERCEGRQTRNMG